MQKDLVKEYDNGEVVIVWRPKLCIHAAECVKALPEVYNPNEKPWIKPKNATGAEIRAQVAKCPSGALTLKGESAVNDKNQGSVQVTVLPDGPLLINGSLEVKDKNGALWTKDGATAFCRCGASENKPYCDGQHQKIGFKDA